MNQSEQILETMKGVLWWSHVGWAGYAVSTKVKVRISSYKTVMDYSEGTHDQLQKKDKRKSVSLENSVTDLPFQQPRCLHPFSSVISFTELWGTKNKIVNQDIYLREYCGHPCCMYRNYILVTFLDCSFISSRYFFLVPQNPIGFLFHRLQGKIP